MVQCDSSNRPVKEGTTRPVMTFIQTDVSQRRDIFEDFLYRTGTRQVDASGVTAGSCGRFCVEGRGYIPRARCQQAGRAGTDNVPKRDNARRQMPVRVLGPIRTGWLVRVPPLVWVWCTGVYPCRIFCPGPPETFEDNWRDMWQYMSRRRPVLGLVLSVRPGHSEGGVFTVWLSISVGVYRSFVHQ